MNILWTKNTAERFVTAAVNSDGIIYTSILGGNLAALNFDGKVLWYVRFKPGRLGSRLSSPVIDSNGIIYIGTWSSKLLAFYPDSTLKWSLSITDYPCSLCDMSTPAIDSAGIIYVGSGDYKLHAINPDGAKRWEFATNGEVYSSPAIGKDSIIYFGSKDHKLYAVYGESSGLNNSPWPRFKRNNKNRANGFNKHCPQAEVKETQIYTLDGNVTLDASPSYDPDGKPLHYLWRIKSKPINNPLELTDSTSSILNINISDRYRGDFHFSVTVTDSVDGFSTATVIVSFGKVWQALTGDIVDSSPAIGADSTIYVASTNGKLYAFNLDGTEKWKFVTGDFIYSSPVIGNDGTIYFGSGDHKLYAVNPDGTKKWEYPSWDFIRTSPAIGSDGTIYFGSDDMRLYAISPDGKHKWHFNTSDLLRSSPVIGEDGTIYFESDKFYAVNPDGTKKWDFQAYIRYAPAIDSDGTIYLSGAYLYALNSDGTLKWKFRENDDFYSTPVIGLDGTIYASTHDEGKLYAVNSDGIKKWVKKSYHYFPSPAIGADSIIYVSAFTTLDNRVLQALLPDGTIKWSFNIGKDQHIHQSSPAISSDGIIYVGTNIGETSGGDIIAINPDGTERWRCRIADEWVDSSPCIDQNGIVYIGSSSEESSYLYAFGSGNVPPDKPSISGPSNGKIGETYSYTFTAIDRNNDNLFYYIKWGDGTRTGWIGPYHSGETITLNHTWNRRGSFVIQAKAKDIYGLESDWSALEVSMPKNNNPIWFIIRILFLLRN